MWYANRSGTSLKRKAFYRETENQKEGVVVVGTVEEGLGVGYRTRWGCIVVVVEGGRCRWL
jgi:hypothetical protein